MEKTSEGQTSSGFEHAPRTSRARRLCSFAVVAVACVGFILLLIQDYRAAASPTQSQGQQPTASQTLAAAQEPGRDFSKFTHTNAVHARLPCLLCHRRDTNSPRPVLPAGGGGHMPCAGCHAQQFADPASPICTICHTDAQSGALKNFPPLRTFGVRFDHSTHTRQSLRQGCATCHKPERRGVSLSIPSGAAGHATCFQCHTPRAQAGGRDISSCGTCHRIGSYSRTPETAAAYRVSFSHTAHTSKGLACTECHQVRAGAAQRRQVTAPQPLMHHASAAAQSCISCHNDKRAFGVADFKNCTRCHRGSAWHF
jgi:c(7)-type cytochrome triheme protein